MKASRVLSVIGPVPGEGEAVNERYCYLLNEYLLRPPAGDVRVSWPVFPRIPLSYSNLNSVPFKSLL